MSDALDPQVAAALAGDRRSLARLLSQVESGGDAAGAIVQAVYPRSGDAHRIGVTGAPGTGKSTLVSQLARELRRRGRRVAIVAVDPTSPFTRGALLGDRVRMGDLSGDEGVFVRSMASRGGTGGLAEQTAGVVTVLAACFDVVLVETVGVGQDELAIAQEAETTLVVTAPGLGDDIQALKAGILEVADVLVVNKADRDGADRLAAELRFGRSAGMPLGDRHDWEVPVLKTVATTGEGAAAVVDAAQRHRAWLGESGAGAERAHALAERQILRWAAARALLLAQRQASRTQTWPQLVEAVASRRLSPPAAAEALLAGLPPVDPPPPGRA